MPEYSERAPETYQNAIKLVKEELAVNPNDGDLRSSLAYYLANSGDHNNALSEILEARKLAPNNVEVLRRAVFVFELGNTAAFLRQYIACGL